MSHDTLILDLAADLRPVRRRRPSREALMLIAVAGAEVLAILLAGLMRPDMGRVIGAPFMAWKIGSLAILAIPAFAIALRSFSPTFAFRHGRLLATGSIAAAVLVGAFVTPAADAGRSIADRIAPAHGVICAVAIVVLGLPLLALLGAIMRRAAPTRPRSSALAAGVAAGTSGALVFTLCCPMNDPLYIVVWYAIGCVALVTLSRWLLPRRFRL